MRCRTAAPDERDAALGIWSAANPGREGSDHPARLRDWAAQPGSRPVVVEDHGRLVAMGLALPGRADDGAGDVVPGLVHLTGICVLPVAQGAGVGGALLDHLLEGARATGAERVTLWTQETNTRARRLFASRGFVPTGRTGGDDSGAALVHHEVALDSSR